MSNHSLSIPLSLTFMVVASPVCSGAVFADFTAVDPNANTASGSLNGIAFAFEATTVRPQAFAGSGVISAVLNGTSNQFDAPFFTPPIATTDAVDVGATSDYRIEFSEAVNDVTLHLSQPGANTLTFSMPFTLLSSDGDLVAGGGNTTISGPGPAVSSDDANGSLLFSGAVTELSWTSDGTVPEDGFSVQFSVVPEPSSVALIAFGLLAYCTKRYSCF